MPIIVKKPQSNSKTLASATTSAAAAAVSAAAAAASSSPDNREMRGTKDERSRPSWSRRIQPSRPSGAIQRTAQKDKVRKQSSSSSSSSSSSTSSSGSSSSSSSSSDDDDNDDDDDEKPEGRGQTDKSPPGEGGRTKNLAGFFAKQTDDVKTTRRKRFEVYDAPGTLVLENEPQRLEGVVRADDPGEWDKPIEIEKGRAKLIASMLQAKKDDDDTRAPRRPFRLVVEKGDPVVLENEPVVLEGVARSGGPHQADEEIFQERGRIRNIAERWKRQQQREDSDEDVPEKPKKPAWLVELESAKESGVYETESTPIVRDDVVRAEDDEPDVISVQRTRNLRKMWSEIEQEKLQQAKEHGQSKTATQTNKQTPANKETDSEEDEEEEEEETSSEDEEEEQEKIPRHFQARRDFGPGGLRKEDLAGRGRVPKTDERRTRKDSSSSASGNSRSSSAEDSPSATKYRPTLYVNEASLKYLPKK